MYVQWNLCSTGVVPRPIPSFSILHPFSMQVCNIEKLSMGLGTRLLYYRPSYEVSHCLDRTWHRLDLISVSYILTIFCGNADTVQFKELLAMLQPHSLWSVYKS